MGKQKEKANIERRSENGSPRNTVAVAHQQRGPSGSGFHREKKDEWAHKDHLFWYSPEEETDEKGEE